MNLKIAGLAAFASLALSVGTAAAEMQPIPNPPEKPKASAKHHARHHAKHHATAAKDKSAAAPTTDKK
jgi:hypothetical protein